jgi:hypothetical protein
MRQKPRTPKIHEAQQTRLLMARETVLVGSGKDIGKDKPAFGWELQPL